MYIQKNLIVFGRVVKFNLCSYLESERRTVVTFIIYVDIFTMEQYLMLFVCNLRPEY